MVGLYRHNRSTPNTYAGDADLHDWITPAGINVGLYVTATLPMPGQWGSERIYVTLSHTDLLNYIASRPSIKSPDWVDSMLSYWDESKRLSILHDIRQAHITSNFDPDLKRLEESIKRLQREALGQRKTSITTIVLNEDDPLVDLFT